MEQVTLRFKISRRGVFRSKNIFATKLARQFVDEFQTRNVCVGPFFLKNPGVYSGEVQQIVKNGKGPSSASRFRRVQARHLVEHIYTAFCSQNEDGV